MRNRSRRLGVFILLGVVTAGGMLFAGSGLACASFGLDQAQTTVDFCFLFDCTNGAYGGLIEFCDEDNPERSLLADCPPAD